MVTRSVLALATLSTLLLAAQPASAQTAGDCNWAGIYGSPPVAISLFEGRYWDPLADNQVGFGFANERPTGYAGPGSWTVNVDWGDGTPVGSYGPGSTALGGPLPDGYSAPPVWLVHTYGRTGTFNVRVTSSGTLNTHSDNSGQFLPCSDEISWPVQIDTIEVQPGSGSGGGSGGGGGTAKCPAAAGFLASARYWNEVAQRHRGGSVEAHKAVIEYWGKASAAFYAVLGIAAADLPGDAISKATAEHLARKETLDGYRQLWDNSLNGKWREISRQLRVLQELRKFLKALGPIGKLDATLNAGESLYWLALAAQQGVLRDKHDAIADAALANATDDQRRAARACGKAGASQHGAAAVSAAKGKPRYTRLARPRTVKGLRLHPRPGMSRRTVRALNALLAGQERASALAEVVGESASRALAAERARKNTWRNRQLRHARKTARRLASHLDAQARRRGQVAGSLGGQAREARSLEISDPARLGKLLRTLGLPTVVIASAKRLGLKPRVLRRMFTTPPAGQLTLPSLADAVADPAGAARDRAWAATLRAFAAGP
ncbi:MAG: hypothetical protein ACXW08_02590 [Solirubrobacteraceae bacterium]